MVQLIQEEALIRLEWLAVVGRLLSLVALSWALLFSVPLQGHFLLRYWILFPAMGATMLLAVRRNSIVSVWVFGVAAALYNPLWPYQLPEFDWRVLDGVVAAAMLASLYWLHRSRSVPTIEGTARPHEEGDGLARIWGEMVPLLLMGGVVWLSAAWVASDLIPVIHLESDSRRTLALPLSSEVDDYGIRRYEYAFLAAPPDSVESNWLARRYGGVGRGDCYQALPKGLAPPLFQQLRQIAHHIARPRARPRDAFVFDEVELDRYAAPALNALARAIESERGSPPLGCFVAVDYDPHDAGRNRIVGDAHPGISGAVLLLAAAVILLPPCMRAITGAAAVGP